MDIIINLINVLTEKICEMNDRNIINMVLSKLEFCPNHYNIYREKNDIFIKCHSYYINYFNDIGNKTNDIVNEYSNFYVDVNATDCSEKEKKKILEYQQPMIYSQNKNNELSHLYLCIKYADIIIDLDTKKYKIIKSYFNIRKPTDDKYKLFETIINNIDNPDYYFIFNCDSLFINKSKSNFKDNIYNFKEINLSFVNKNDDEDDNDKNINIELFMDSIIAISSNVDIKPSVNNNIKINIVRGSFI
jgi:hypothetical protein